MKLLLSLSLAFLATAPAQADDMYSKLERLYASGRLPESRNVNAESAWAGKCIAATDPNLRMNSAIFFHMDEDDVLGGIFTMVPLFNLYEGEMNYDKMQTIALGHLEKGKVLSSVEMEAAPAVRGQPTSYQAWMARYGFRQGKLDLRLRGFVTPTGKPGFVARSTWAQPDHYVDNRPVYCYYSERVREDGSDIGDDETVVPAPSGAPVPRD